MGVRLGGGGCPSSAPNSYTSAIFRLKSTFSLVDIFWHARTTSLLCYTKKHPRRCWPSRGAFLSALSSIWSFSVHGVGILTSSAPPSANCSCRMHLFEMFPILTQGHPATRVASPAPCLFATQHFFQLIHQVLKDGQCGLASEVIFHPAMLAILHLRHLFSLPIDFCCFEHVCLR